MGKNNLSNNAREMSGMWVNATLMTDLAKLISETQSIVTKHGSYFSNKHNMFMCCAVFVNTIMAENNRYIRADINTGRFIPITTRELDIFFIHYRTAFAKFLVDNNFIDIERRPNGGTYYRISTQYSYLKKPLWAKISRPVDNWLSDYYDAKMEIVNMPVKPIVVTPQKNITFEDVKWNFHENSGTYRNGAGLGMHRWVMRDELAALRVVFPNHKFQVGFKDKDKLNCSKTNLRIVLNKSHSKIIKTLQTI